MVADNKSYAISETFLAQSAWLGPLKVPATKPVHSNEWKSFY